MKILMAKIKENYALWSLGMVFLVALFNPMFKKYDYGAGWPMVLLLGVILVPLAVFEYKKRRERSYFEVLWLVIFAVMMGVSFYFSQTRNLGFSEVLAFLAGVNLYLLLAHQKIRWMEKFLKLVVWSAALAVLVGYFFYFNEGEVRMFGPFFNLMYHANVWPNAFALFLLMVWPIFLHKYKWNVFGACILGIILSGLLLTFSRGALIAFGGQIVLVAIYFWREVSWKKIGLVVLSALVALGLFLAANATRVERSLDVIDVEQRAEFGNSESLTSKTERMDFWLGAIDLAKEKPLTGFGPFSFRQAYSPIQKTLLGNSDHPHNIFLKFAAENGVIAAGAFLAFLLSIFVIFVGSFGKLSAGKRRLAYLLGVSIAGAIAHSLIDYNFNFVANLLLFFLFLAFLRSLLIVRDNREVKSVLGVVLALLIGGFSLWEGGILALANVVDDHYYQYSLFPRNYYLDNDVPRQHELNPLDAQAWYLSGDYLKAIELNPLNDLGYYREYVRTLGRNLNEKERSVVDRAVELVDDYFSMVANNVHFTAYTPNVEAADELVDLLLPYLEADKRTDFGVRRAEMLENAQRLRGAKTY